MHGHMKGKTLNLLHVHVTATLVAILREMVFYKRYMIKLQELVHKYKILIFQSTSIRIQSLTKKQQTT